MTNKTHQLILLLFLTILSGSGVQAGENIYPKAKHAVGFGGASASGPGITYRLYSTKSFYQTSFFSRANSQKNIRDFMLGFTYGHVLSEISIAKALPPTALVFLTSLHGRYVKDETIEGVVNQEQGTEKSFHTGVGIALEIGNTFSPGLLFSIGTTYLLSAEQIDGVREWNLGPHINAEMIYNW